MANKVATAEAVATEAEKGRLPAIQPCMNAPAAASGVAWGETGKELVVGGGRLRTVVGGVDALMVDVVLVVGLAWPAAELHPTMRRHAGNVHAAIRAARDRNG